MTDLAALPAFAQVPPFTAEEIATTPGSTAFDTGRWTIEAEGADIWNNADQFRYTHIALNGDGEVLARVVSLGPVTGTAYDQWAKAGVMIRQSNAAGSAQVLELPRKAEGPGGSYALQIGLTRSGEMLVSPIRTVAQTERGFELACQGHGLVIAWPLRLSAGEAWSVEIAAQIAGKG